MFQAILCFPHNIVFRFGQAKDILPKSPVLLNRSLLGKLFLYNKLQTILFSLETKFEYSCMPMFFFCFELLPDVNLNTVFVCEMSSIEITSIEIFLSHIYTITHSEMFKGNVEI